MGMVANLRLVLLLSALALFHDVAHAHSDASKFSAAQTATPKAEVGDHHDQGGAARYPATLSVDPRHLVNVVIKINARIVKLNNLYPGKRIRQGDVLGEMESAELETIQSSFLAIFSNMDAVQAFSMTGNEKLIDAKMNLVWRGMSEEDIKLLETSRAPLKRVRIKAPSSGYIYSLDVVNNQILNTGGQVGQYTATGTTIATIMRPVAIQVETDLPVSAAAKLKPGMRATVHLPSARRGQVGVAAVVQRVFAYANPTNQRQRVRLKLTAPLPDGIDLLAGQLASVSLGGEVHDHVPQ